MSPGVAEVVFVFEVGRSGPLCIQKFNERDAGRRLGVAVLGSLVRANDDAPFSADVSTADPVEVPVFPPEGGLKDAVEFRDGDGFRHLQPPPDLWLSACDADAQVKGRGRRRLIA
nr:hypothetical protein [Arthrobacter sp. FW305-BF8]